jgi:hypothetical protein
MKADKTCFVISPIGEEGSEIRKRADQVLKFVITPSVRACGYEPLRADKISEPGLITSQLIQHLLDDPLVIADLTGMNPNVFYELAIRHAIRKPLVQLIQKGEKIPFDVAGMRTIPIDNRDLDVLEEAKAEIERQIRAVEGKKPEEIESPISASVDLQTLKKSDRPEDRTLGEILSAITQLRTDVAELQSGPRKKRQALDDLMLQKAQIARELEDLWDEKHALETTLGRLMEESEREKPSYERKADQKEIEKLQTELEGLRRVIKTVQGRALHIDDQLTRLSAV